MKFWSKFEFENLFGDQKEKKRRPLIRAEYHVPLPHGYDLSREGEGGDEFGLRIEMDGWMDGWLVVVVCMMMNMKRSVPRRRWGIKMHFF